ncbi:MAG: transposase [Calothrix sp. SM1_7_51]|nr:transposase [Calothrix sp. SM1_7_51]
MKIFKISRSTIYNYFNDWEDQGLVSLYDKKGRGRKSKLNNEQKEIIKEWVKENPKNLDKVTSRIFSEWGIKISSDTIRRILHFLNMSWHRIKRVVPKKPELFCINPVP